MANNKISFSDLQKYAGVSSKKRPSKKKLSANAEAKKLYKTVQNKIKKDDAKALRDSQRAIRKAGTNAMKEKHSNVKPKGKITLHHYSKNYIAKNDTPFNILELGSDISVHKYNWLKSKSQLERDIKYSIRAIEKKQKQLGHGTDTQNYINANSKDAGAIETKGSSYKDYIDAYDRVQIKDLQNDFKSYKNEIIANYQKKFNSTKTNSMLDLSKDSEYSQLLDNYNKIKSRHDEFIEMKTHNKQKANIKKNQNKVDQLQKRFDNNDSRYANNLAKQQLRSLAKDAGVGQIEALAETAYNLKKGLDSVKANRAKRIAKGAKRTTIINRAKVEKASVISSAALDVVGIVVPEALPFIKAASIINSGVAKVSEIRKIMTVTDNIGKSATNTLLKAIKDKTEAYKKNPLQGARDVTTFIAKHSDSKAMKQIATVLNVSVDAKATDSTYQKAFKNAVDKALMRELVRTANSINVFAGTMVMSQVSKRNLAKQTFAANSVLEASVKALDEEIANSNDSDKSESEIQAEIDAFEKTMGPALRDAKKLMNDRKEKVIKSLIDENDDSLNLDDYGFENKHKAFEMFKEDVNTKESLSSKLRRLQRAYAKQYRDITEGARDRYANDRKNVSKNNKKVHSDLKKQFKNDLISQFENELLNDDLDIDNSTDNAIAMKKADSGNGKADTFDKVYDNDSLNEISNKLSLWSDKAPVGTPIMKLWTGKLETIDGLFTKSMDELYVKIGSKNVYMIDAVYNMIDSVAKVSEASSKKSFSSSNKEGDALANNLKKLQDLIEDNRTDSLYKWLDFGVHTGNITFDSSNYEYSSNGEGESEGYVDFVRAIAKWISQYTQNVPS